MKKPKKETSLADRIKADKAEAEAELDRLAEEMRPSNVPGPSLKQMWMAKAGGNVFEAYLLVTAKGL